MSDELGERQGAILNAVVQEFIVSGEPVGSKHLVGRYRLSISSATVRNDMSRLEDLGYLSQPHTSAGRIPTDRGYRFFVDSVPKPVPLAERQERAIEDALQPSHTDVEELMHRASDVLSRFTHHASAVLAPALTGSKFRQLDLVRLAPGMALVVIVTHTGRVEKRLLEFSADAAQTDLDDVRASVNATLADARLADGERITSALAAGAPATQRPVIEAIAKAIAEVVAEESRVFVGGASNLADGTAFAEVDTLQQIIETLEAQTKIVNLLAGGLQEDTTVQIGSEVSQDELKSCSVVMSSYTLAGTPLGTVGVIGPTRMDYAQAMAMTRAVARTIQEHLEQITG